MFCTASLPPAWAKPKATKTCTSLSPAIRKTTGRCTRTSPYIYFDTKEKADWFRYSPEDVSIHDNSKLYAHTYCEVDYFRKDPADFGSQQLKS